MNYRFFVSFNLNLNCFPRSRSAQKVFSVKLVKHTLGFSFTLFYLMLPLESQLSRVCWVYSTCISARDHDG